MKNYLEKIKNGGASSIYSALKISLVTLALFFFAKDIGPFFVHALFYVLSFQGAFADTASVYLGFWAIWAVFLAYFAFADRPMFGLIGSRSEGNNIKNLLTGFGAGALMCIGCVLTALFHGDIYLYYDSSRSVELIVLLLLVFLQSSAEELVFRGYLYHSLRCEFITPLVAIGGNSLLFAAVHLGNRGITPLAFINILLAGVLFSVMVYYCDSLWMAMAAHTAWNYFENIVFGLPNSGIASAFSVFRYDTESAGNSFAYDSDFGMEASLSVTAMFVAAVIIMIIIVGQRNSSSDPHIEQQESKVNI